MRIGTAVRTLGAQLFRFYGYESGSDERIMIDATDESNPG
jgi:hypothetical protein